MRPLFVVLALILLVRVSSAQAEELPTPERVVECPDAKAKPFPLLYSKRVPGTFRGTGLIFDSSDRLHGVAEAADGSLLGVGFVGKTSTPSERILLVSIDRSGRVSERLVPPPANGMFSLDVGAYPGGTFALFASSYGAGLKYFAAEVRAGARPVWRPIELPKAARPLSMRTVPDGFVIEGDIQRLPETKFIGKYLRDGTPVFWRETEVRLEPLGTMARHMLANGDIIAVKDSPVGGIGSHKDGISISRSGQKTWSRQYECAECKFLKLEIDDNGIDLTVTNDLEGGTVAGLDMLFFALDADGRVRPGIGVRFPSHGYSFDDGRPVYSFPPIVDRREMADGQQILVSRMLVNSLASNLIEEQLYLLTLGKGASCRMLVDRHVPPDASSFVAKASFAADGSILLYGWAFAGRRWSADRLIWVARLKAP